MTESSPPDRAADAAATAHFRHIAGVALDVLYTADPVWASELGAIDFDARLPDLGQGGAARTARDLADGTAALDDLDDAHLTAEDQVDLEILRTRLTARLWAHAELAEHSWNPLLTCPDRAISVLTQREGSEPEADVAALLERLAQLPDYLASVRQQFGELARPQVEISIDRTKAAGELLREPLAGLLRRAGDRRAGASWAQLDRLREDAIGALMGHAEWLSDRLSEATREPRLPAREYAAKLWYALDTETLPGPLLDRAESDLMALEEELVEVAGQLAEHLGLSRAASVGEVVAASQQVDEVPTPDIPSRCRAHLASLGELLTDHWLSVPAGPIPVRTRNYSPADRHGSDHSAVPIAAESPGILLPQPGSLAVYRSEVNPRGCSDQAIRHAVARWALPGRLVQQAHARRFAPGTDVRAALSSESFLAGWSWYAAELVAEALHERAPGAPETLSYKLQQLLSQLRCTVAAIVDLRVHTQELTQADAVALMTSRGHLSPHLAKLLWHRAICASTELATGYVGYQEVVALARDIRLSQAQAGVRAQHDRMLAHGAPPPRLLRVLLTADG